MKKKSLLERKDLSLARMWFVCAAAASRQHTLKARIAMAKYGDHGPDISGCVRNHFPENIKNQLRGLAHAVSEYNDCGMKARPPRVRLSTMIRLAREVCKRDGTGFYGFQQA